MTRTEMDPSHAQLAQRITESIRNAADPTRAAVRFGESLLASHGTVRVLSKGKAGATMMTAAQHVLGARLSAGLVVAPGPTLADAHRLGRCAAVASDHPVPTARSEAAAEHVLRFVADGDEPLAVLLSGGASAMVCRPVPGVTLGDIVTVSDRLMRAGATIHELNAVRKRLDATKGGRLGLAAGGRPVMVGVLSDVLGDPLDVISSGPFAGDRSSFDTARAVLDHYGVRNEAVDAIIRAGCDGRIEPTPGPGDPRLAPVSHTVLASNATVVDEVARSLSNERLGRVTRLPGQGGSAHEWASLVERAWRDGPGAMVIGGESTVAGVPEGAKGGPVQTVVLDASLRLRGREPWLLVGVATDGIDGPTDAGGAIMDHRLAPHLHDAPEQLERCRSYDALDAVGALLRTGPTGTNLNDIVVLARLDDCHQGVAKPAPGQGGKP